MDLLHNYPGFQQDIEVAFKDLIEEFDLKLTEQYEGSYLLNGTRCVLWITYDRGQIGCNFKQITDDRLNPGYEVWSVDRQLYPIKQTIIEFSNGNWATPKQQLEGYSNVIQTKFKN